MKTNITATINNETITIFYGATLKNGLLKVDEKLYQQVMKKEAEIRDQFGNEVNIQGAIDDGFSYRIIERDNKV